MARFCDPLPQSEQLSHSPAGKSVWKACLVSLQATSQRCHFGNPNSNLRLKQPDSTNIPRSIPSHTLPKPADVSAHVPAQNYLLPTSQTQMPPPMTKPADLSPRSSSLHTRPSLPYVFFLVKQLVPFTDPVRATQMSFNDATTAHAALLDYVRNNHPYHRSIEPRAGVRRGGGGRVMEGYIAEYEYRDGDWIDEEVVGWVWVERDWRG
ncbi:uncharacterized protein CC84DRAFT_1259941 [Paraphaeosphaeria sporulosa]|uniref:Uncharacterized protein n=1 Tax=Paraphaeosphaeria sporulosa TaxID=1460663 RepID=A0A177CCS6_9PLEO|nr:uncharacterized protein CC84DRAFT_1259941 [Paraphaeosphaeria sporulosa]OAG04578.1 hypothetical protein CC84DRAFT_1259941 [Paraphaeosphaeria sporulosa]